MARQSSFHKSAEWRQVRLEVLRDALYICAKCGDYASHVDHKIPISAGGAKLDKRNLHALCADCHRRRHLRNAAKWETSPLMAFRRMLDRRIKKKGRDKR